MRYLTALMIGVLIPTAVIAKGECKDDRKKFCKDVMEAKGDVGGCLDKHMAELSEACKAQREAKTKERAAEEEKEKTQSDTNKVDEPSPQNPTTSNETPNQ